eukprot:s4216_g7.t1
MIWTRHSWCLSCHFKHRPAAFAWNSQRSRSGLTLFGSFWGQHHFFHNGGAKDMQGESRNSRQRDVPASQHPRQQATFASMDPPFAWDAASATSANSDIPQQRRELGYCVSEPHGKELEKLCIWWIDGPIKGRFNGRHHTKKEAQLPPKPLQAAFASQADTKVVETTEAVPWSGLWRKHFVLCCGDDRKMSPAVAAE